MNNFDRALLYTLHNEGAFSDDPLDAGGATRWGITRVEAESWLKRAVSLTDMETFPLETARLIYLTWYWSPLRLDQITELGIATAIFDVSVVRGVETAAEYAQRTANHFGARIKVDGEIGALSVLAINGVSLENFIPYFTALTRKGFQAIIERKPDQKHFLKGWLNRADHLLSLIGEI